jgi:hypothetical protein
MANRYQQVLGSGNKLAAAAGAAAAASSWVTS